MRYNPNVEVQMWQWFNNNQKADIKDFAELYGVSEQQANKLRMIWSTGANDSFDQAVFSLLDGSPTRVG